MDIESVKGKMTEYNAIKMLSFSGWAPNRKENGRTRSTNSYVAQECNL